MKTIGLIGGMSWESTALYYRHINQMVRERLGGLHSAKALVWSFDFDEIATLQSAGDWATAGRRLVEAARALEGAGAECIVLCTNTMHRLAGEIEASLSAPFLHIADATAEAIKRHGVGRPILLGTRFTMEQDFYTGRLLERHGIRAVLPDQEGRDVIHGIIYDELVRGIVTEASKRAYLDEVARLRQTEAADALIMGCTEITMLIGQGDFDIPVFDTTLIHAEAAVDFALS